MNNKKIILGWLLCLLPFYSVFSQETHWQCDFRKFQYDMTVYATLQLDSTALAASENYEIAAFCGAECRGVASVETIESVGKNYYYLRVRSNVNDGETITFKCFDKNKQCELDLDNTMAFESQGMTGSPSKPFKLIGAYEYKVEYIVDDKVVVTDWLKCGTEVVAPEPPLKEGYLFVKWSGLPNTMPTHDVRVVAVYEQEGLHITDGIASFTQAEDVPYEKITYTRNFKNTNWQALYVPFEIPVTEELLEDFEVAYIYDTRQYDWNDDGEVDEVVIESFKKKNGVLDANYPYLIRAREKGEKSIIVTDAMLYTTVENSYDCSSMFETYSFTGTYSRMPAILLPQDEGYYALSGGVWQPIAEGASLGAFRFYLKIERRNQNAPVALARSIRMRIVDENGVEDGTTGIDNSQLIIDKQSSQTEGKSNLQLMIYDLQGRRIIDTDNLKGLYIVNGRKMVF